MCVGIRECPGIPEGPPERVDTSVFEGCQQSEITVSFQPLFEGLLGVGFLSRKLQ